MEYEIGRELKETKKEEKTYFKILIRESHIVTDYKEYKTVCVCYLCYVACLIDFLQQAILWMICIAQSPANAPTRHAW